MLAAEMRGAAALQFLYSRFCSTRRANGSTNDGCVGEGAREQRQAKPNTPNPAVEEGTSQEQMAIEARNRVPSAAVNGKNGHSLISNAKFRQLYELALKLQLTTDRGNGSRWLRGREAVLAGVAADLRADDVVIAEPVESLAQVLRGRVQFEHVQLGIDKRSFEERVIAALSDAVADRIRKTGRVSVIFSDGARADVRVEKVLKEARAIASSAKLAVLFVEDGKTERARLSRRVLAKGVAAAGESATMPVAIPVDTQDVVAMYRVAHESIARAREGSGPTHIVGVRWQAPANKRKRLDFASEDAVTHLEHWLTARGLPAQEWRREIVAEFAANGGGQDFSAQNAANGVQGYEGAATQARLVKTARNNRF